MPYLYTYSGKKKTFYRSEKLNWFQRKKKKKKHTQSRVW